VGASSSSTYGIGPEMSMPSIFRNNRAKKPPIIHTKKTRSGRLRSVRAKAQKDHANDQAVLKEGLVEIRTSEIKKDSRNARGGAKRISLTFSCDLFDF